MRIAVTAKENSLEGLVDPRFGRASGFLVYDSESKECCYYDNQQNLNATQGAGIQAAQNLQKTGAEVVITGHCGPKAFKVLGASGIKVVVGAGETVVQDSIDNFLAGTLKATDAPDVEGHWV